jgi:hypothetical protein
MVKLNFLTWAQGYKLVEHSSDMSNEHRQILAEWTLDQQGISLTTRHMDLTESYPSTHDAVFGNYI